MMLEDANMEAVPQIALKGAEEELKMEEADASPGPSGLAETQPPDEEQAGLEWFFSDNLCHQYASLPSTVSSPV